ncbi:calcium-binding protein, partial [Blastochloris sulfoviridis]|uniref:calcium-binding protein n=1 Tax=Blastochloris sulfoviridis TaxID=50712 RepID=UPI0014786FFD
MDTEDRSILVLGPGITRQAVTMEKGANGELILRDGIAGDRVTLVDYFNGSTWGPQVIQFDDGTYLTRAEVINSINSAPIAHNDLAATDEETPLVLSAASLLAND